MQVPMVAILAHREIRAYGLQAFLKRSEVWWGLRVAGLLSLFLALMKAHDVLELSIHNHMEGEIEAQEDADNDAEAAGEEEAFAEEAEEAEVDAVFEAGEDEGTGEGQEEVGGGGKSNWWETALEGLFKATGQELALQGMRVARGEKLTDEEKARIRELEQVQVSLVETAAFTPWALQWQCPRASHRQVVRKASCMAVAWASWVHQHRFSNLRDQPA